MVSQTAADTIGSRAAAGLHASAAPHAYAPHAITRRARRVIALLVVIVILGCIDLHLTQREIRRNAWFAEANPIAACAVSRAPHWLDLFKGITIIGGSAILLAFRRHPMSEAACWVLLIVHVGVQVQWAYYFDTIRDNDPAVYFDRSGYAWTDPPTGPPAWMSPQTLNRP